MARRARHRPAFAHEPPLALVARVAPPACLEHLALGAAAARAHAQASAISTRRTHETAGHTVPVHAILVLPADAAASSPPAQAVSRRSLSLPRGHLTGPPAAIHISFTYPETTVARGLAAMKRHQPLPASVARHRRGSVGSRGRLERGGDPERGRKFYDLGWRVTGAWRDRRSLSSRGNGGARHQEGCSMGHLRNRALSQAGQLPPRARNRVRPNASDRALPVQGSVTQSPRVCWLGGALVA
jgi:hypothetical protein